MDIQVRFAGGRRVEATFKGRTIAADQPVARGGNDSAPAPFDLFLASLATCSGYYVYDFCLNRDIPIDDVGLILHTTRDDETRMLTDVSIEIVLPEVFPTKYEKAVIRAVDHCAVKRHLVRPPHLETFVTRVARK